MRDDQDFNFDDMPEPEFDSNWLTNDEPAKESGSALPDWLNSAPLLEDEPKSFGGNTTPDWLSSSSDDLGDFGSDSVETSFGNEQPAESFPDWLSSSEVADEPDFDFDEPPLLTETNFEEDGLPAWDEPAPTASLGLKRLGSTPPAIQPNPEPPPPPEPQIRKLGQKRDSQSFSPDEMTFDEWERQENRKEYEQVHAEDIAMTEEVPDWFVDNVEIGDADRDIASLVLDLEDEEEPLPEVKPPGTTGSLGANYVPDWFMGLEEQNLEDAPEWARTVSTDELSFETLVDASAFAPPEPEIEPLPELPTAPSFDEDVPDWFKGVNAPTETSSGDDWMAAFDNTLAASAAEVELPVAMDEQSDAGAVTFDEPDWFAQSADEISETPEMMQTFIETPAPSTQSFEEFESFESFDALDSFETASEPESDEPDWLTGLPAVGESQPATFAEAPEDDFFATQAAAEQEDVFAGIFDEPQDNFASGMAFSEGDSQEFSWEDAASNLFAEGGPAQRLFADESPSITPAAPSFAQADPDAPDWLREYEAPDDLPQLEVEDDTTFILQRQEAQEEQPDWLGDFAEMDFAADSDFSAPKSGEKSSAFSDKELKSVSSGTSIDDLLGLSGPSANTNLPTLPGAKGLMVPGKSQTDELMSSDLFEGIDDDVLKALDAAAPGEKLITSETEAVRETFVADRPEWISDLRPDVPVTLSAGGIGIAFEQQRISDLPDSLRRLREQSLDVLKSDAAVAPRTPAADSGPLAGVTGGLSIAPQATALGELSAITQLTVSDYQAERITLLEGVLDLAEQRRRALGLDEDAEALEAPTPTQQRRHTRARFDRFLISIILLAVMIGPFVTDALHVAEDADKSAFSAQQQAIPEAVNTIQPGDYVLVAFEFGPTSAGELNTLAEAVLRDILSRRGVPIILSTNPLGTINARRVIENLADDIALLDAVERDAPLRSREDYVLLPYVSGGIVGIRGLIRNEQIGAAIFATDADGEKTELDFGAIDPTDFAFVVVAGGGIEDIRNWAEQFDVPGLPKYALMTAGAEPLATSYVRDAEAGYQGYLAGYRDTYRYNQLRNSRTREAFEMPDDVDIPDPEISQWHSMALGAIVASGLIGLGAVFNLLRGLRRRRR